MKPIAVSMGEPAGIGPEIILAAWRARHADAPVFYVAGDFALFDALARSLGARTAKIGSVDAARRMFPKALPVFDIKLAAPAVPGTPDARNAKAVIAAIDHGARAALDGDAAALVTAPIQKSTLYEAGFAHPGHTEYLAHLAEAAGHKPEPLMLLAGGGLKVALVTIHKPLKDVPALITTPAILAKARLLNKALMRDFAVARPRIAVAALNPHGGEKGALGREEEDIIAPAVEQLKHEGIHASGPHPADTLFHAEARAHYDAALCMYHDQALIPLKTLAFHSGVNATLGLPFVRTSPDHGTALGIAGKGVANAGSLIAALDLAAEIALRRHSA